MKKYLAAFLALLVCVTAANSELVIQKNAAYTDKFNIWKNDGTVLSGAAGLDCEISTRDAGGAWSAYTDCTNEASEDGTTGSYTLVIAQAEANHEWIRIQEKSSTTGAIVRFRQYRTTVGNPLNAATTDDGGTINVTGGKIDEVATLTGHTAQTGDAYAIVNSGTYGNSAIKSAVDDIHSDVGAVKSDTAAILTDTAALDTANELRTLLTGGTDPLSTLTAANVWQTDVSGYSTAGQAGTYLKGASAPAASAVADAVWNEAIADHLTGGTTGAALNAAGSAGDPWATLIPGSYTAGQAGYILGTNINATIGSRSSHSAADVWAAGTRTLTAGTNISLAKGSGITGFNDPAASDVAALILVTPANKLATDASGRVTVGSNADKTGYTASTVSDKTGYTCSTVSDKTGYSLSQAFPANFSSLAITTPGGAVTVATNGDKTGYTCSTVSDKTGYSLTQAFPSNFSSLAISAQGKTTVGTNDDKAGYSISGTKQTLDALNDVTAASVWAAGTRTLTSGGYAGLTAADIDAIWNEEQSGHATAGTFGKYLDAQVSTVGGGSLTLESIIHGVWDEPANGHTTAGTMGKKMNQMPTIFNVGP